MYYTYTFFVDGIPEYVGKGVYDRWLRHYTGKGYWQNHLKSAVKKGKDIIILIVPQESERAAWDEEIRLITKYGRKDLGTGPLYNLTSGGDGGSLGPESRKKISIARTGKPLSAEHRAKISALHKGKKVTNPVKLESCRRNMMARHTFGTTRSEEEKKKLSELRKGKLWTEARRNAVLPEYPQEAKDKIAEKAKARWATGKVSLTPRPCTIDGDTIYPSLGKLIKALGKGINGARSPHLRFVEIDNNP